MTCLASSTSHSALETLSLVSEPNTHTALAAGPRRGECVLLLHGWPECADCWHEVPVALGGAGYRAVAVDQRGFAADAPKDIASCASGHLRPDALVFAGQLGIERLHLVAHDWGGLVAWGRPDLATAPRASRRHTAGVISHSGIDGQRSSDPCPARRLR
ncbi:alpha/beta fold hydrolase [Cupriavidus basilensis]|uniref:alpha/beta fold hydrolase n=1 Tax=Cupriavidus basilensis TaxID=68895 RepID=UPI003D33531D